MSVPTLLKSVSLYVIGQSKWITHFPFLSNLTRPELVEFL